MANQQFYVVNKGSVAIVQRRLVTELIDTLVQEHEVKKGKTVSDRVRARYNRMIEKHLDRGTRRLASMLEDIELYNDKGEVKRVQFRSIGEGRFSPKGGNTAENPGLGAGWKLSYEGGWGRANTGKIFQNSSDGTVAHEAGHVALLLADEYRQFMRRAHTVDGKSSLMAVSSTGKIGPLHMEASVLPALREITGDSSWQARWRKGSERTESNNYKVSDYTKRDYGGNWKPPVLPKPIITEKASKRWPQQKIGLNQGSVADIASIPGVSRGQAEQIVRARKRYGKFKSWNDVLDINHNTFGIGAKTLELLKQHSLLDNTPYPQPRR
jgi:DNA uptake protein ComE-like DNA-binding protein